MKPEITEAEVRIYFSKFYNIYQFIGYLIAFFGSLFFLYYFYDTYSIKKEYFMGVFGLVIFCYSIYKLHFEIQDIRNVSPQIILSKNAIFLAKKGEFQWGDIDKIEAWTSSGKSSTSYLDLTLTNGEEVSIEVDDLDIKEDELNQFIRKFKSGSNQKYTHSHPVALKLLEDPELERFYALSEAQSDKFSIELRQFINDDFEAVKKLIADLKVDEFGPISIIYETISEFHPDKHEFLISEIKRVYASSRAVSEPNSKIGVFDGIVYENFSKENLNTLIAFYAYELNNDQTFFVHHALTKLEELSYDLSNQLPRKVLEQLQDLLKHSSWKVRVKAHEILSKCDSTFNDRLSFMDKIRARIFTTYRL